MLFSRRLFLASLLPTALAQFNLSLAISELPACASTCSALALPAAGCALENIPSCYCTNVTLQTQVTTCIVATCNQTEQFIATTVSQNNLCKGVPQQSRSAEIIRVVIVISAITFPIIILRLFSRYIISQLWWDDWVIILSGLLMVPMSVFPIYNATRGFGEHVWDVPPQNIISLEELYYVSQILYVVVQNSTKISILLLFLRIFPDKRFRLITKICIGWIICHATAFFVSVTLQCVPPSAIWDPNIKGKCLNPTAEVFAGAALSIFEDIVIVLLPVRELTGLNLTTRKKLAVIFMFALGSFACITSIVRLKYIANYSFASVDATWTNTDVVIWSVLEVFSAMICACLMAIRPLLAKYMPSIFRSTLAGNSNPGYTNSRGNRMDSKTAGAQWSRNHGSAIELKSTESTRVLTDAESSHEERDVHTGGFEVWVTRSVEMGNEPST